jgi:tRNA uridine 5-carboxymethylaminomethyl modification enzyme
LRWFILVVNDPTGRVDVDYADVPGLSNEARSKREAARSHSGAGGRLDGLTSAALSILAAYLRREVRRRNSVATA